MNRSRSAIGSSKLSLPARVFAVFAVFAVACLLLVFGVRAFGEDHRSVEGEDVVYALGEANLRACPSTSCDVLTQVERHRQLVVVRSVSGEKLRGDDRWLEVEFGVDTAFVHPSVIGPSGTDLGPIFELVLSVGLLFIALAVGLLGSSSRLATAAAEMNDSRVDTGLYGVAVLGGVATGSIGFALSRADGQSLLAFWSSAFVSFGAGLVGSAIAFVVFQRVVRPRPQATDDLREDIAELRSQVDAFMRRVEPDLVKQPLQRSRTLLQRILNRRE